MLTFTWACPRMCIGMGSEVHAHIHVGMPLHVQWYRVRGPCTTAEPTVVEGVTVVTAVCR